MKNRRFRHFIWLSAMIALLILPMAGRAGINRIWAVNDGEKIKRDDLNNPNRLENSAWDGQTISIFGARNEIVGFQVIVEAGASGAKQVDVSLDELVHADGSKLAWRPPTEDPTDTRDRQIERFIEHYLEIAQPSPPVPLGWFYEKEAAPKDMIGWVPDALVPFNAKSDQGGGPFDIQAQHNQGIWFDIYIPKEMPAGAYKGTVRVAEGSNLLKEIPISLRVYDFTLPDQTHLPVMIFLAKGLIGPRHGAESEKAAEELIERYHRMGHRHRIELTDAYVPPGTAAELHRLGGAAFTAQHGYSGPGEGIGYRIVPASFWEVWEDWMGDKAHATADAFMIWLKKVKPDAITFLYIADEPRRGQLNRVKKVAELHRDNPGPGRGLPMFVTARPSPVLEGLIDIWATVANQVDLKQVAEQKAKGRDWWYYNGQRPQSGTNIIDAPAMDGRVFAWACWKYDINLWYYWSANHWRHNLGKPTEHHDQNVWSDPVTFARPDGVRVNGDGVLLYPGQDESFPEQDRGIAGPIASIRLKNIRRGVQDYEYLWLAGQHGLQDQAREIVEICVPQAFSEAKGDVSWSERGSDWDLQRRKLGELIENKLLQKAR